MRAKLLIFCMLSLLSSALFAYQLNGTMYRHSNGFVSVTLEDENGTPFHGVATYQDDSTYKVTVRSPQGIVFSGNAVANGDEFDMQLMNAATGEIATGTLDEEDDED